jgi:hypothetical protein
MRNHATTNITKTQNDYELKNNLKYKHFTMLKDSETNIFHLQ